MKTVRREVVPQNSIPEFIIDIINMNYDRTFLKTNIIECDDELVLVYDIDEYKNADMKELNIKEALQLIKKILIYEEINENHLIFPEDYLINRDNIYIRKDNFDIKLIYYPDFENKGLYEKIKTLINEISVNFKYGEKALLDSILDDMDSDSFNTLIIVDKIETLIANMSL
ncbi:MAG TPA: DUF6382 domain-containing protein [Anaerovoracaceae bacterium]|nr:DUF6382 domain-containing protein [Anaerovoracaceae bacterium]